MKQVNKKWHKALVFIQEDFRGKQIFYVKRHALYLKMTNSFKKLWTEKMERKTSF